MRGVEPPADAARRRPSPRAARGRRRRGGSAAAPARGRRGRAPGRRSAAAPASSSSRATTPSTGLVCRSERSASRTRRSGGRAPRRARRASSSSTTSAAPNVAWISGANVSMSGHITITSRGSSVGSSSSRCRIASRRTSTWRARPWQPCTWMLRSLGSSAGATIPPPGQRREDQRPAARHERSQRAGARLPRPRAPGRGPARRDPAPARRRPDARAARRDRDVPGHRDVRAADPGDVRRGRGRRRRRGADALPAELRPPDLRVRLADRSLRQTNPVLGVVARLLELADERLTASQVLDLADREPVRRRFGLDDDDLARLEEWVAASGIRWGLDAAHRAPFKLDGLPPAPGAPGSTALLARRDDDRGRAAAVRRRPAARRRRQRRDRPRRALRRARRPPAAGARRARRAAAGRRLGGGARRRGRRARPRPRRATPGSAPSCSGCSTTSSREADGGSDDELALAEIRALLADRLAGPPDARELPHRPPDDLHARADALGAAPRRLPARPRRRRLPAQGAARRRRPHARRPARRRARPAHARTASCCSTR